MAKVKQQKYKQRELPSSFKEVESHSHNYAKKLLHKWLCQAENRRKEGDPCRYMAETSKFMEGAFYAQNEVIAWRKSAGVYLELPFYENSSLWYFDYPEKNTGKIRFIPDVVIFHQGCPSIIFEVVHKHGVSQHKAKKMAKYFGQHHIQIYTISARWILDQVGKPKRLIAEPFKLAA